MDNIQKITTNYIWTFPCWLWYEPGEEWHWISDEYADEFGRGKPTSGWCHIDTPTMPESKPPR